MPKTEGLTVPVMVTVVLIKLMVARQTRLTQVILLPLASNVPLLGCIPILLESPAVEVRASAS